jgi:hypothetical protein
MTVKPRHINLDGSRATEGQRDSAQRIGINQIKSVTDVPSIITRAC